MLFLNFAAWFLFALGLIACMPVPKADAATKKPIKARAAAVTEGTAFSNDALDGRSWPDDPCGYMFSQTGQSTTAGSMQWLDHGDCLINADYLGSIRYRLGDIRSLLGNPAGLVVTGGERGPLDFIKTQTTNTASRLLVLMEQTDGLEADLADVKASSAGTRTAVELTAERLSTTNDRLSSLDDRLEALDASIADVADAIEAQGPNVGSPTFPGASEANASYVRLAATDSFSDELAQRQESSVMFAAGLIAALLVGMGLWRSLTGGAA